MTVPNLVSLAGLALTVDGARRLPEPLGVAETVTGRLLDLADGALARSLGQSTSFGAGLDAVLDKAALAAIGLHLWWGCPPSRPALLVVLAQNGVNAVSTVAARLAGGHRLQPTREGKRAMAAENAALSAYALSELLPGSSRWRSRVLGAAHATAAVAVLRYGVPASRGYVARARRTAAGRT